MKKIFRSLAALAVVMFAGCVNDLTNEVVEPSGKTTVTVGIADTKTYLGDLENGTRKVYWSENDQICINGVASSSVVLSDDKRQATFDFVGGILERPFSILYPAEMFKDARTITLPAVQAAADNSFGADAAPMATYQAKAGNIMLQHLAGVVRLQVKLPAASTHASHMLSKVEFRGKAGEQVSGDFTVDYEAVSLTGASAADADKVVTANVGKALSADSNVDVFVVVPAVQYEQGFSVRLIDAAGHFMDIATNDITVSKGEIKAMPPVEFAPTGTLAGVEIASASDLVAFAKAYNAGEYAGLDNLNVQVTSDIVFDDETNAEWANIGSIGSFTGTFDGQKCSIRNWKASRPLFAETTATACIKGLNIDASCILTAPYSNDVYYGGFVGHHKGLLSKCHNNASVTVSGEWANAANVGGLVGRVSSDGKIDQCSMSGDVTADATFVVSGTIYLGGIAGCIAAAGGKILDSEFGGTLTTSGRSIETVNDKGIVTAGINYVGGITGLVGGTVDGCSTAALSSVSAEYGSAYVQTVFLGGIAGNVKEAGNVADSDNYASVSFSSPRASSSTTAYVGGVAGALGGADQNTKAVSMSSCENNGSVQSNSDYHNVYLGGVVAHIVKLAVVDDCHNRADGTVTAGNYNDGLEYIYMGGVIGRSYTSSVSNISNAASVEIEALKSTRGALNVGGCFGWIEASIEGNNTITNTGAVSAKGESTATNYIAQGGVVGTMYASNGKLSYVNNTGSVTDAITVVHKNVYSGGVVGYVRLNSTVEYVTNGAVNTDTGNVMFTNSETQIHTNTSLGGIVGAVDAGCAAAVKYSDNYGKISRVATSEAVNGSSMICGGIVGILKGAGSSVEECDNHGKIENYGLNSSKYDSNFDTAGQAAGGIVGFALGTADVVVQIKGCTNDADCHTDRAYVGGIAGYIRYATIDDCDNKDNLISGAKDYARVGGITGCMGDKSIVQYCDVTNATIDGMANGNTGGITGAASDASGVKELIQYSNVDATVYNSKANGRGGSIVGLSRVGLTIEHCKVKGKVGIGGTATELTSNNLQIDCYNKATVTDCSLWE